MQTPSLPRYDFSGRVAVVTGGANGIGHAVVRRLAESGAQVAVWDLAPSPLALPRVLSCTVDIADPVSIQAALHRTVERFGKVDQLVNSAGWAGPTVPVAEMEPSVWDQVLRVNLSGTFLVCRALVPLMQGQGSGHIVNIASLAGKEGTPNAAAYSAAKAGVLALTKSLGKELADQGVRVNAIAPAAVDTTMLAQMSPAHVQTMIGKSPQRRLGQVDEVAELVAWLCSDACSFNSGAVFDLSGGRATY